MSSSLNQLYQMVGLSKQAVAQYGQRQAIFWQEVASLEVLIQQIRKVHGGCGLEKLYYRLRPRSMGRDRFIAIFRGLGYGLKKRPYQPKTTIKGRFAYPNLIAGMAVLGPNQVWQTDLTYQWVGQRYYYLIFIIDIYTKRVLGYGAFDHMRVEANVEVLQMALAAWPKEALAGLIHHSDRGSQYIAKAYTQRLKKAQIHISMGLTGRENAYAERINGIIKNEYLAYKQLASFKALKRELRIAVKDYNAARPHQNLARMTPLAFENAYRQQKLKQIPISLIPAEEGPDFRLRKKKVFQGDMQNSNAFCPMKNNHQFYQKRSTLFRD